MSLCIVTAAKTIALAATAFTLSWTHSVEKIRWEEHWQVRDAGLKVVEARVEGSGAGMDPPEGSVFVDGGWNYVPKLPVVPALHLAASGATVGGWSLCTKRRCMVLGADAGAAITLEPCKRPAR